jgi:hypothetical protein
MKEKQNSCKILTRRKQKAFIILLSAVLESCLILLFHFKMTQTYKANSTNTTHFQVINFNIDSLGQNLVEFPEVYIFELDKTW